MFLTLYTRKGCCLCEGLEKRLTALTLKDLQPPLKLLVIDIDQVDINEEIKARYDLKVPVMLFQFGKVKRGVELPRVSPRLSSEGLFAWLQKELSKTIESD